MDNENKKSNIKIINQNIKQSSSSTKKEFILEGLGCANCAAKMEQKLNNLDDINSANINFITKTLSLEIKETSRMKELIAEITDIVKSVESHVKIVEKQSNKIIKKEIMLQGLCCANCAGKIERESNKIDGVKSAVVDFISTKLIMEIDNPSKQNTIIDNVKEIVKRIEPDVNVIVLENKVKGLKSKNEENEKVIRVKSLGWLLVQ